MHIVPLSLTNRKSTEKADMESGKFWKKGESSYASLLNRITESKNAMVEEIARFSARVVWLTGMAFIFLPSIFLPQSVDGQKHPTRQKYVDGSAISP